jgi:alkylated DNA repair dioxygenase AlkB
MQQLMLFPVVYSAPAGLHYQSEFIGVLEETDPIRRIQTLPLHPFQFGAFEGKRRVVSFGWRYDYSERRLEKGDPAPTWLLLLAHRIEEFAGLPDSSISQILCTEYPVGSGIGWHRDRPHFEDVFGLSLASACTLRLRRKVGEAWERYALNIEPRSLYMMRSEARHVWEHSISPLDIVRYSITFRTMKDA